MWQRLFCVFFCVSGLCACTTFFPPDDPTIFKFDVVAHDETFYGSSEKDEKQEAIVFYGSSGERFWVLKGNQRMRGAVALCDGRGKSYGVMSIQRSSWDFVKTLARDSLIGDLVLKCVETPTAFSGEDGGRIMKSIHKVSFVVPKEIS